jgi:hypothetical protein
MGVLRREDFERVAWALTDTGFMDATPSYDDFYKGMAQ